MKLGERIAARMAELDVGQSELARRVGVSQQAIGKLVNGSSETSRYLHLIARELQTTPQYLVGETDDPSEGALPAPTPAMIAEQLDVALVPELALGYSMGGGSVFHDYEQTGVAPFQKAWLRGRTKGTIAELFVARGRGDSMEPTLRDGDTILVDTAQKEVLEQDAIWALSYGDLGMIKRVRKLPGGGYQINSDNKAVSPIDAYDGEMHVVGRVIWIGRWL